MVAVPAYLATFGNWIVWRSERNTKVPYTTTGQLASTTNAATWCDLATAQAAVDWYSGLGFVFSAEDDCFGIDLDGCIDGEGRLSDWADWVLRSIESYAEYSPSGTGIKIFGRGARLRLPRHRWIMEGPCNGKQPQIEIYQDGRYFAVTGERYPGSPEDVRDCAADAQRVIDQLMAWVTPAMRPAIRTVDWTADDNRKLRLAEAYLATIPPAVSGQGGHNTTFRAACKLLQGFALSEEQAYRLLAAWNEQCEPPWSEKELWHKIASAAKSTCHETLGYLIPEPNSSDTLGHSGVDLSGILSASNGQHTSAKPLASPLARPLVDWHEELLNRILTGQTPPRYDVGMDAIWVGPGCITTIGGGPGIGKTTFAVQLVTEALERHEDCKCLYLSVEVGGLDLVAKQLSIWSGVDAYRLRERPKDLDSGELEAVRQTMDELGRINQRLFALELPHTLQQLTSAVDQLQPQIVVLDYAQRIRRDGKDRSDPREACTNLMNFARELCHRGLAVIVISSLNRAGVRGQVSDLTSFRESGELEYGSDECHVIHRVDKENLTVVHAKSRYRPTCDYSLTQDKCLRFRIGSIEGILNQQES